MLETGNRNNRKKLIMLEVASPIAIRLHGSLELFVRVFQEAWQIAEIRSRERTIDSKIISQCCKRIILDQSLSMKYQSAKVSKLEYAQLLAASLGYLMLKQQDAVGLTLFDDKIRVNIPARSKRSHLNVILSQMENISAGPETRMAPILHQTAEIIKKRGLIILISDLFDSPEEVLSGLQHFRYKGHEVVVFHILDPQELKLDFPQRTRFRDMESGEEMITDPWHIQADYQRSMEAFCNYYKIQCRQNNIDYVRLTTDESLDLPLSEYLLKRKRVG